MTRSISARIASPTRAALVIGRIGVAWIAACRRALYPAAAALLAVALCTLLPCAPAAAAGAPPITVDFDHLSTGFELDGLHRDLPCESCHLNAVFKGTPRSCGTCHITGSTFNATPKTATHIQSSNNCAACHNTNSFRPDVHFDHREVMGSCVGCHNGTIAEGKSPDPKIHPQTSNECEACHTVMSWNPPKTVDHAQIPMSVAGFCIICHGTGKTATPQNPGHIKTTLECGDCHLTTNWLGANFDHTGIVTGCSSCHNGVKAVGKPTTHMATSNLCESCHTTGIGTKTPSWVPSGFDHTQMTSQNTCLPCHSGSQALASGSTIPGQPPNHVPLMSSTADCVTCHANTPSAETWTLISASIATLHSGVDPMHCLQCHAGETFAGVPAPYSPMTVAGVSPTKKTPLAPPHIPISAATDCSGCHSGAYSAGGFGPATAMGINGHKVVASITCDTCHDTGKSFYVGSGPPLQVRPANHVNSNDPRMATGDCSICHETADWVSTTMPAGHMPNPANQGCATCHASAPNDYSPSTLAANSVLHTGIAGNCGQCHGDNVTALTWFNNFTPKDALLTPSHIPYLAGTDCSSCHASSTYAAGTFGPMNMTQAKHAFTPPACNTCHEAGLSFYMGVASPALQGRPADHTSGQLAAPNDCSLCHTTANWSSNVMPAGHMPNPGNQGCTVCHTGAPANYTTFASVSVLHTGIGGNCAQCHGNATALSFYNNGDIPNEVPKFADSVAHIPYLAGADCSSCHASNYAPGGFGPATAMSAAKHAFVPAVCTTCHEAGLTFWLGTSTPALQGRPPDHLASGDAQQKTGDCALCHSTTDWSSTSLPIGHMPNPGAQACAVCHTAIDGTFASYATITTNMTVMHTGIAGNCGQCHGSASGALTFYNNNDPIKAAVLAPAHIPYLSSADCSSCHVVGASFGPTQMSAAKHAFVPAACDTCHEKGLSFFVNSAATPLQGRPADHSTGTQASGDCSGCHNTTDWTSTVLPPNHMPNPGAQACSVCHIAAPGNYTTFASVSVLHTGINGNCAQCHGDLNALTFYNNGDIPNEVPKFAASVAHIPYLVTADCSSCHTPPNYVTGGFGPATAMSPATHAFVPTTCDTCHDTGKSFYLGSSTPPLQTRPDGTGVTAAYDHIHNPSLPQMTTGDCSQCHNTTAWTTPKTLPAGHMPIPGTQTCTVCHIGGANYAQLAATPILHTGITSGCGQCHGGATQLDFYHVNIPANFIRAAASLSPPHMPSFAGNDCSACHAANYVSGGFGPMNMTQATHTSVSNVTCVTCHGTAPGAYYIGGAVPGWQLRPADHSAGTMLTGDCSVCHTTANWLSTTLPSGHMPNPANQSCNTCHISAPTNYKAFAPYSVFHTGIAGNCAQCHGAGTQISFFNNDMVVVDNVLSPAHIPYIGGVDCSSCHASATYATGTFGPMNMTPATHAFVGTTCNTCHGTPNVAFFMNNATPGLQLRPSDHTSGNMAAPNDCGGCHTTANWNSTALPSGHMPNPANQACATCHTSASTGNYKVFASNAVLHTGIAGNCSQCHGAGTQLSFYNNDMVVVDNVLSPPHIPYVSGTDCSSCHQTTTYAPKAFGPMNMTQATHAFVATSCSTCHGTTSVAFSMGSASPTLQLRPADHTSGTMLTGDCSGCHTTANWDSTTLPAGHMPNPGNQTCNVCHTSAPSNYKVFAANSVLHTGITGNCSQCHGAGTQLSFYNNDMVVVDNVLSPPHIPYLSGTDCSSCHQTTTYAPKSFGPMNMTQATHAFVATSCSTCHGTTTVAFSMGSASPTLQLRPADHTSGTMLTGDCGGCHTTANWNSTTMPSNHMPNPANQACSTCHTKSSTGDYTQQTLASNAILHTGISSGCITCHGAPNATPPVYANAFTPKSAVLSPVHIPTSSTACESCHSNSTFTSFLLSGGNSGMTSAKHTAMFAVIGGTCDGCHDLPKQSFYGVTNLTVRESANHHAGQDCSNSNCHNTSNWDAGAAKKAAASTAPKAKIGLVVRPGAAGASAAAAAAAQTVTAQTATSQASTAPAATAPAVIAPRLPAQEVLAAPRLGTVARLAGPAASGAVTALAPIASRANSPLSGSAPLGASMSHVGVTGNCAGCHNGVLAVGKGAAHIASNTACENCHTTIAWLPARFDHQGVTAACVSCHNGVTAPGKPTRHIQTNQDCGACHGTLAWAPSQFSHVGASETCRSCHNGITATGKQLGHVNTTLDCGSCHSTVNWTVSAAPSRLQPLLRRPKATPGEIPTSSPRGAHSGRNP